MDKIDRLGWAAGTSLLCYGVRLGVRSTDAALLSELRACFPPGARRHNGTTVSRLYSVVAGGPAARPGVKRFYLVYANASLLVRTPEKAVALLALEGDVKIHVAEAARGRLFVHAGVVGWRGRAIVIPGRSLSGKSRLVAALVEAGARYYSDEYAVFDRAGRVHAFPCPLSLRDPTHGGAIRRRAKDLGATPGRPPIPVALVVASRYRAAARWRPRVLSPGKAGLELLANTVPARSRPIQALSIVARVAARARTLKGDRGEASELALRLLAELATPTRRSAGRTSAPSNDVTTEIAGVK